MKQAMNFAVLHPDYGDIQIMKMIIEGISVFGLYVVHRKIMVFSVFQGEWSFLMEPVFLVSL